MALQTGYRLSMFFDFSGYRSGGWSENFWNSGAFPTAGTPTNVATLIAARQAMTSNQCNVTRYRISDVRTFRNVINGQTGYGPVTPTPSLAGDPPQTKLFLVFRGAGNYKTGQWIGGIPDAQIQNGGVYTPNGVWPTALANFTNLLLSSGWSIANQDRTVVPKPIDGLTNAGIVTADAHGFTTGDYVRIKNVRGFTEANRIWRVVVLSPSTFQLVGWVAYATAPTFYGPKAVAVLQKLVLTQISSVDAGRGSNKRVGRPTGQLIGRRRRPRLTPASLLVGP
jgi:hypothetical protein